MTEAESWPMRLTRATVKLWWLHFFMVGLNMALLSWVLVIVLGLAATVEDGKEKWAKKEAALDVLIRRLDAIEDSHPWTPKN